MASVPNIGKGLYQAGEFNSTLLSGDITTFFSAPAAGQKQHVVVTNDMLIIGWTVAMQASGSIVVDIWRASITDTEVNGVFTPPVFPTTNAASIAGTFLPTISSALIATGGSPPGYPANASSMFELGWGGAQAAAKAGLQLYAGDIVVFDVVSYTAGGAAFVFLHCLQGS
jgi:hypothetical protein